MPRLPPALIRLAASQSPHLPLLLRVCRDLPSARNELRWLQEHARDAVTSKRYNSNTTVIDCKIGDSEDPLSSNIKPKKPRSPRKYVFRKRYTGARQIAPENTGVEQNIGHVLPKNPVAKTIVSDYGRPVNGILPTTTFRTAATPKIDSKTKSPGSLGPSSATAGSVGGRGGMVNESDIKIQKFTPLTIIKTTSLRVRKHTVAAGRANRTNIGKEIQRNTRLVNVRGESGPRIRSFLATNIERRSRGVPLQHIIGTQPFGNLEIKCSRAVLIPRPETETYTEQVARLLLRMASEPDSENSTDQRNRKKLRILDLCSGTGCIALLLHSILKPPQSAPGRASSIQNIDLEILGLDISSDAISSARENLQHNIRLGLLHPDAANDVSFGRRDILKLAKTVTDGTTDHSAIRQALNSHGISRLDFDSNSPWDVIIANPPYISAADYAPGGSTERSVRKHEPKQALVPPDPNGSSPKGAINAQGMDLFYWPLARLARSADAQLVVMEVGDTEQAGRVHKLLRKEAGQQNRYRHLNTLTETWKDDGSTRIVVGGLPDPRSAIGGHVSDRAVVMWSGDMADWRRKQKGILNFDSETEG